MCPYRKTITSWSSVVDRLTLTSMYSTCSIISNLGELIGPTIVILTGYTGKSPVLLASAVTEYVLAPYIMGYLNGNMAVPVLADGVAVA